ncbi:MAG TPA: carboxylate-amine ligase [Chloroflexia bacterium]|jgi:carboxylate-amine ligase|nr:carboxylate-amine ligase [Chloroflexia bacterium]
MADVNALFSIGIEEEFQIVDPSTGDLRAHIQEMLTQAGRHTLGDQIKPEMMQSMVETVSKVCATAGEARQEVMKLRRTISDLANRSGLAIVSAGTHPFSHWQSQLITTNERYKMLEEDLQDVVRSILIFGLHVHVGIPGEDQRIEIMNEARYFLPHLLALSTSSPFWLGRFTGLKSYRTVVWQQFPRTGIPSTFDSWSDYQSFVDTLVQTNCIDNAKKIWWDVRPHPFYPTIEFRVCDMPCTVDETICLAALFQAIVVKLYRLRERNLGFRVYNRALIQENKWRAMRYGIDGKLIDFGKRAEVPMRDLALELLEFVDDVVDDLGSRDAVNHVHQILADGSGADRQLKVYRQTGDMRRVVEFLIHETMRGVPYAEALGLPATDMTPIAPET